MNIIMAGIQILTVNCQGIGEPEKRKYIFNYLKQKKSQHILSTGYTFYKRTRTVY